MVSILLDAGVCPTLIWATHSRSYDLRPSSSYLQANWSRWRAPEVVPSLANSNPMSPAPTRLTFGAKEARHNFDHDGMLSTHKRTTVCQVPDAAWLHGAWKTPVTESRSPGEPIPTSQGATQCVGNGVSIQSILPTIVRWFHGAVPSELSGEQPLPSLPLFTPEMGAPTRVVSKRCPMAVLENPIDVPDVG